MVSVPPQMEMVYSPSPALSQGREYSPFPTPSPFTTTNSLTSPAAWWRTSHPPLLHLSNLFLRFLAFFFSVVSLISLVALPHNNELSSPSSFADYTEFRYSFSIAITASLYSVSQLFKGIYDIAFRSSLISDKICDYFTFFFDQLVAYLLVSASSASAPAIGRIQETAFKRAAITSVCMSSAAFLAIALCTLLSGYKLCKRIIW